jgi:hypothetical protein
MYFLLSCFPVGIMRYSAALRIPDALSPFRALVVRSSTAVFEGRHYVTWAAYQAAPCRAVLSLRMT